MIDKIKNNTRIKLISLMSALVLWLYVMAIVDPEETRVIEDLPVTINNMSELESNNLVLYPDAKLTTDIYITGKLSNLKKIKPEDIHVYGDILNPIEGNNELYLKASISERVDREFKTSVIIVPLDKVIDEKRSIDINIEGSSKDKIVDSKILSMESIKVSGPRTLVQQVQKVVGTLNIKNETDDFTDEVKLTAINENGEEISGVELESEYVTVDVKLLKQKTVPIEIKLIENGEQIEGLKNYKLNQSTITIKGKKEVIDTIDVINTQPIDLRSLMENDLKEVPLDIPQGIIVDNKYATIQIDTVKKASNEFVYLQEEIELRNNVNNIDISTLVIPREVKVILEYTDDIAELLKSDIVLYIDLSENVQDSKYEIKYETKYQFSSIVIEPNIVEMK